MSLGWGKKPENLEESPKAEGEHETRTQEMGKNQTSNLNNTQQMC